MAAANVVCRKKVWRFRAGFIAQGFERRPRRRAPHGTGAAGIRTLVSTLYGGIGKRARARRLQCGVGGLRRLGGRPRRRRGSVTAMPQNIEEFNEYRRKMNEKILGCGHLG